MSYEDLVTCLYRIKNRPTHETLNHEGFATFTDVVYLLYTSFRAQSDSWLEYDGIVEYYNEEHFNKKSMKWINEIIGVIKDYAYYKRNMDHFAPSYYTQLENRYLSAIDKLKVVPRDVDKFISKKLDTLCEEVARSLKQDFAILNIQIDENIQCFIDEINKKVYQIEQISKHNSSASQLHDWEIIYKPKLIAYKLSKKNEDDMRKLDWFAEHSTYYADVIAVLHIYNYETRVYVKYQQDCTADILFKYFVVGKKHEINFDDSKFLPFIDEFAHHDKEMVKEIHIFTGDVEVRGVLFKDFCNNHIKTAFQIVYT